MVQLPQCAGSLASFAHAPAQLISLVGHCAVQLPRLQFEAVLGQTVAQSPQWSGSFWVFTHSPVHTVSPAAHTWPVEPVVAAAPVVPVALAPVVPVPPVAPVAPVAPVEPDAPVAPAAPAAAELEVEPAGAVDLKQPARDPTRSANTTQLQV